jgi:hypothetical protein
MKICENRSNLRGGRGYAHRKTEKNEKLEFVGQKTRERQHFEAQKQHTATT